jgi:glutamate-1-semialdehyde 2,1-aminomutase
VRYLVANRNAIYPRMEAMGAAIETGILDIFKRRGITACVARQGSAFSFYFMEKPPADLHDITANHDFTQDVALRRALIQRGVFFVPIATKQCSLSAAHTDADVAFTLEQFESAVAAVF